MLVPDLLDQPMATNKIIVNYFIFVAIVVLKITYQEGILYVSICVRYGIG